MPIDDPRRRGLLSFMDTCFVAELCILEQVLAKQKTLHLALQLEALDLPAATLMVQASIEHCERELSGGFASEGWAQVLGRFNHLVVELDLPRPQRRPVRRVKRDEAAQTAIVLDTEQDHWTNLYEPILRATVTELQRRFSGRTNVAFKGIDSLSPPSPNFLCLDHELQEFATHYGVDTDTLRHDIQTYTTLVVNKREVDREFVAPACITDLFESHGALQAGHVYAVPTRTNTCDYSSRYSFLRTVLQLYAENQDVASRADCRRTFILAGDSLCEQKEGQTVGRERVP